jgi:hypothetical protein
MAIPPTSSGRDYCHDDHLDDEAKRGLNINTWQPARSIRFSNDYFLYPK